EHEHPSQRAAASERRGEQVGLDRGGDRRSVPFQERGYGQAGGLTGLRGPEGDQRVASLGVKQPRAVASQRQPSASTAAALPPLTRRAARSTGTLRAAEPTSTQPAALPPLTPRAARSTGTLRAAEPTSTQPAAPPTGSQPATQPAGSQRAA